LIKIKSIDPTKAEDTKWNDPQNWPRFPKKFKNADPSEFLEPGSFWMEWEEFYNRFDYILVSPVQPGFNQFSFLRKGSEIGGTSTKHEVSKQYNVFLPCR